LRTPAEKTETHAMTFSELRFGLYLAGWACNLVNCFNRSIVWAVLAIICFIAAVLLLLARQEK
jgi:hypothetical protein